MMLFIASSHENILKIYDTAWTEDKDRVERKRYYVMTQNIFKYTFEEGFCSVSTIDIWKLT